MAFVMIYNTLMILGFIGLSIYFNKWWIVFFALLFVHTYKEHINESENDNNG